LSSFFTEFAPFSFTPRLTVDIDPSDGEPFRAACDPGLQDRSLFWEVGWIQGIVLAVVALLAASSLASAEQTGSIGG
jgi:hypothetical protein